MTNNPVRVRRAAAGDVDAFVASNAALFAADAAANEPTVNLDWPKQYGRERFLSTLGDASRLWLLAETRDGDVVGHLSGHLDGPEFHTVAVATLGSLFVREDFRGAGVGAQLVDAFRDWAEDSGAGLLEVTAYVANDGARRFYVRHGFTERTVTLQRPLS